MIGKTCKNICFHKIQPTDMDFIVLIEMTFVCKRASCSPGCPATCHVAKRDNIHLILLSLCHECWNCR